LKGCAHRAQPFCSAARRRNRAGCWSASWCATRTMAVAMDPNGPELRRSADPS
jgi:hypothetical protein